MNGQRFSRCNCCFDAAVVLSRLLFCCGCGTGGQMMLLPHENEEIKAGALACGGGRRSER